MNEDLKRRRGPDAEGDGDHRTVVMDELGASARTKQGEQHLLWQGSREARSEPRGRAR